MDITERRRKLAEEKAQLEAERSQQVAIMNLPPSDEEVLAEEEEQLLKLRREVEDAKAIQAAAKKYGKKRIAHVSTADGTIVMRPATSAECDQLAYRIDGEPAQVQTKFLREHAADLIVHPNREDFEAIMEKFPGLWGTVFQMREALINGSEAEVAKKA